MEKFKLGEKVWAIVDSRAKEMYLYAMLTREVFGEDMSTTYTLMEDISKVGDRFSHFDSVNTGEIFKTKQDLINSL